MLWIVCLGICCGCAVAPPLAPNPSLDPMLLAASLPSPVPGAPFPGAPSPGAPLPGAPIPSPGPGPAPLPAAEWNHDFDVSVQLWRPTIGGKLKMGTSTTYGSNVGLRDQLGFDRYEYLESIYIKGHLDTNWFLDLNYVAYEQSGHNLLDHELHYNGQLIPSESDIWADMDFTYLSLNVGRKLYSHRGFTYGLKAGLFGARGETDISTVSPALAEVAPYHSKDDWTILMPAAGGYAAFLTRYGFEFSADAKGTFIKYEHSRAHYLDLEARVAYYFADNFMAYLGYHYSYLDCADDDIDFLTRLKGPTIGMTFRF